VLNTLFFMADITKALENLFGDEGGYANNPADSGGETWKGIARNRWPAWSGWKLIDSGKGAANFPANLIGWDPLQQCVVAFYTQNYWRYDQVSDQMVAEKLFNESVNMEAGADGPVMEALQNGLDALGYHIPTDGAWGPQTLTALELELGSYGNGRILHQLRGRLALRYHKLILARPADEAFAPDWFMRAAE
jgi:lysozyme family protein